MIFRKLIRSIACLFAAGQACGAPVPAAPFRVAAPVRLLLEKYCHDCHVAGTEKGEVRLDNLESLALGTRLDLLNRLHEQVFPGGMPPKKKDQPTEEERNLLTGWIAGELRTHHASKLEEKLRMPESGNVVDHGKLFSGQYRDLPGFTPDRRWLISEFIFNDKINRMAGVRHRVSTNPFLTFRCRL